MSNAPEAPFTVAMARRVLETTFGLQADDKLAAWFAEELLRTSKILPAALSGQASLFDVRTRQFDALVGRESE